jgi:histidyl-tRNA synthetase
VAAFTLAETLRQKGLATETDMLRRSLKAQLRDANRTGVKIAVIIGEKEMENQNAQVKDFRTGDQSEIRQDSLVDYIVGLNL